MKDADSTDRDATVADGPRKAATADLQLPSRFTVKGTLGEGGMGTVVEAYDVVLVGDIAFHHRDFRQAVVEYVRGYELGAADADVLDRLGRAYEAIDDPYQALKAYDRVLARDVAIKILPRELHGDANIGTRFLREARAAARLRHPGIVQVYDIDEAGRYIVMEIVRGESLAGRLWREPKLPVDEVRRIGIAMAKALAAAHAAGIVHRDVKPANVLLGEAGEVKLADFGVAYFGDSELTSPGTRVGTPAYMAPEQLRGKEIDARADVYAAGVTLFEAVIGERPSDDPQHDLHGQLLHATGDRVLSAAIARAIRDRPAERFADGAAFAAGLEATEVPASPPTAVVGLPRRGVRWLWIVAALALMLGGATAWKVTRGGTSGSQAPQVVHRRLAFLPFIDRTKNPLLDFASAGLPNVLGLELRGQRDLAVVGYYQLLGVAGEDAPRKDWIAAARTLGADVVVQGEITGSGETVHIAITVETLDGAELSTIERDAKVEEVPEVVRRTAANLGKIALGRDINVEGGARTAFAADRELQLGIAALDREHLEDAIAHLRAAVHHAPELALAHYYLAIALSWDSPASVAQAEIDKALATGKLDEAQRGMLAGVSKIANVDHASGIEILRPLAEKFPDDRQILYALFECLFHGGRPGEAMTVYRRIHEIAPKFRLALVHVFTYYVSRADEAGMAWALELNEPQGDTYSAIWEPRILVARRQYPAAIALMSRQLEMSEKGSGLEPELAIAYAVSGQLELASSLVSKVAEVNLTSAAPMLLGLASLRGDEPARRKWLDTVLKSTTLTAPGPNRAIQLILLTGAARPAATRAELQTLHEAIEASVIPGYERSLNLQLAQTLLAEALEDKPRLEQLAASPLPEVSELARAALARGTGDHATAAAAMRRSIAVTGDGRFLADQWWQLARDLHAQQDHAGVIAACDEVMRPRLVLTWAWAAATADCLAWTAEAHEALGDLVAARRTWQRLLATRTAAPASDPAVRAARAALARLPGT